MYKKPICSLILALALFLSGNVCSGQILIDDHFAGDGVDVDDTASVNGGFALTANSIASAATADESASNAEVTTTGGANGNAGITSITSIDPLSDEALSRGLTVEWVVTGLSETTQANGNTYTLQTDNVFFNTIPYVGVMFSGKAGTTPDGVRFVAKTSGGDPTHSLSALYNYERSSYLDGFTVSFTISATGWMLQITGLDDPSGSPIVIIEEGAWPAGFSLSDVVDNESFVSAHAQKTGGDDLLARYDRCRVWVGSAEPLPYPSGPNPRDGAKLEATWATLSWRAGDFAVSHDVYIGESFDDVNDGAEGTFVGKQATTSLVVGFPTFPIPGGLVPGTTYYWRIDEVNDADPNSPWKGDVWSFWVPPRTAYNSNPADGVMNVLQDVTLSWTTGFGASLHQVYLGDNLDDVNNASGAVLQQDATYTPSTLEVGKTYYWRVDEFDSTGATHTGNIWSFTTVPDVAITDPNLMLWWTLDEGEGTTAVDRSGHSNHGAVVGGTQWTDGYQGAALTFGSDVYVEVTGYPGITGTAARTLCAWIKTTEANRTIMSWGQNVAGKKWRMRSDATGGLHVEVNGGYNYGVTNIADGRWHHVAVTFEDDGTPDALDTLLYVDGQPDATADSADEPIDTSTTGAVRIGKSAYHNSGFIGVIDDARIYDKVLAAEEIQQLMLGNTKLAGNPVPDRHATVDIRQTTSLSWSPGDTAASHNVYFGTDRDAVANAIADSPEFQANQAGTSLSVAGLIEFGGGDYYWRVDETEADGTMHVGTIWKFTVPDYLIVDDFEAYDVNNNEIWWSWKDGLGYPARAGIAAYPGNGTGSAVGDETSPTYMEMSIVHGGAKSMPVWYTNNTLSPAKYSEVELTLPVGERDWTVEGVGELSLWFRGETTNAPEPMYVAIANIAVVYHDDPIAAQTDAWTQWVIPLQTFADQGIDLTNVDKIALGVGTRGNMTAAGGAGKMLFDDIQLHR